MKVFNLLIIILCTVSSYTQQLYLGADLSYVNEMEDCGVKYKENGQVKDVYRIFADYKCNLVRLRLWHTPEWYDQLNSGKRYSDFNDVRKSIRRSKEQGMQVLLNFHLSDNWADPQKQLVPKAWLPVVNNLAVLKDSLYNYVFSTLDRLASESLLPEMVQIGNETNKGILLSPADNNTWTLNWSRNSQLFNTAIKAVRDIENKYQKKILIALHLAAPAETEWLLNGFVNNGVVDFDVVGMSYYWAWHKPTTIAQTGQIIKRIRQNHPGKKVMIFETGYIWTTASNDSANNIINDVHPSYSPASPANQRKWLEDLTDEVVKNGGEGVLYWEPAWVSSPCRTQWGQGSHQEHAAFFDFSNNLIKDGGITWLGKSYVSNIRDKETQNYPLRCRLSGQDLVIETENSLYSVADTILYSIYDLTGRKAVQGKLSDIAADRNTFLVDISSLPAGWWALVVGGADSVQLNYRFVK
ncbi:MAG: glycosyl hydrolase 53 family protein [Saprospiraceae bacterium]|nr:glycosyl hydrolase 53 family protein [Saprospiraceae bacterium]